MKGLPVLFAPCKPGARPTINKVEVNSPKLGTGALNQSGFSLIFFSKIKQSFAFATIFFRFYNLFMIVYIIIL